MIQLIALLIIIAGYAFSWAITVGVTYLICLCFSWQFSLLVATGIWLILCLVKAVLGKGGAG